MGTDAPGLRFKRLLPGVIVIAFVAVVWVVHVNGGFPWPTFAKSGSGPFTDAYLAARRDAMKREHALEPQERLPWAGRYIRKSPSGDCPVPDVIDITSSMEYFADIGNCMAAGILEYGTLHLDKSGSLAFKVRQSRHPKKVGRTWRAHLIPWGDRRYIVFDRELDLFRKLVADGTEPRHRINGYILLGEGDWNRSAKGKPSLPESLKP